TVAEAWPSSTSSKPIVLAMGGGYDTVVVSPSLRVLSKYFLSQSPIFSCFKETSVLMENEPSQKLISSEAANWCWSLILRQDSAPSPAKEAGPGLIASDNI